MRKPMTILRSELAKADFVAFLMLIPLILLACDAGTKVTGVAGTGNAGRVAGQVVLNNAGTLAETRLLRVASEGLDLIAARPTDSSGSFRYDSIVPGRYVVEAWQDGMIYGRSAEFQLVDSVTNLVVVLIRPRYVSVDLRALGEVDSAYLDYPENHCSRTDSTWTVRGFSGDSGTLFTKVSDANGSKEWLLWRIVASNGSLRLIRLGTGSTVPGGILDTTTYFPTSHTLALWTFDTIAQNRFRDLGRHHLDLGVPSGKFIEPSPHGKALIFRKLPSSPLTRALGDSFATILQPASAGQISIRMRIKLRALPLLETYFAGIANDFRIGINSDGQIQILSAIDVPLGAWNWNSYTSPVGTIVPDVWQEIEIARDIVTQSYFAWIDRTPILLYSQLNPVPKFRPSRPDTFYLSPARWSFDIPELSIDELEIRDTIDQSERLATRVATPEIVPIKSGQATAYTFAVRTSGDSAAAIDTSRAVVVGATRNLYLRFENLATLADRRLAYSMLSVYAEHGDCGGVTQRYELLRANGTFAERIRRGTAPIPGIDIDTIPVANALDVCSASGGFRFLTGALVEEWLQNPSTNNGMIIRPVARNMPDRTFKTGYVDGVDANYLTLWLQ